MKQLLAAHKLRSRPYAPDLRSDALAVLEGWMQDKGKGEGEADQAACAEALQRAMEFRLEGFVHYASGRPVSCSRRRYSRPCSWCASQKG